MSLEIVIDNVDLQRDQLEGSDLPADPVMTSSALNGSTATLVQADLFEGPVSFLPEIAEHYTLYVPLHGGTLGARTHVDDAWHDILSARPHVHVQHPQDRVGWRWGGGARILRLQFDPAGVQRFVSAELRLVGSDSKIKGLSMINDAEICRYAAQMVDVLEDRRPGQAVLFESVSRMCLVYMARTYLVAQRVVHGGLNGDQLADILSHIDAHLSDPIRIHDLSDLVHMSDSAFLRAIKAVTGETPHELVRRRRLDAASRLLREDILSLGQIASMTGFADQAHLSRCFKNAYGISPSRWRRQESEKSSN